MKPGDPGFFRVPFYFLNGHGKILLQQDQRISLKRYLENGGFLFANDDYGMDNSFRRLIKELFPGNPLVKLPVSHPVYRIWFAFPKGLPKIHKHDGKPPGGYGLYVNGRLVLLYVHETDIFDGWDPPEVHKDPPQLRKQPIVSDIMFCILPLPGNVGIDGGFNSEVKLFFRRRSYGVKNRGNPGTLGCIKN